MKKICYVYDIFGMIISVGIIIFSIAFLNRFPNSYANGNVARESDKPYFVTSAPIEQGDSVSIDKEPEKPVAFYNEAQVDLSFVFNDTEVSADKEDNRKTILIYHTHGSEKYADGGSVIQIGKKLSEILKEKYGLSVIYCDEIFDTDYSSAYQNAYLDISRLISMNNNIGYVIDIHRDSSESNMTIDINNKMCARLMLVLGTDKKLEHSTWKSNIMYAMSIQKNLLSYGDIVKNIYVSSNRYNQHIGPKSVIVEVGSVVNTTEEALNSLNLLAEAIKKSL